MLHATINPDPAMQQQQLQQVQVPRAPLRRATYIHVSDLTSAYNIDHKKLEHELARVKVESKESSSSTQTSQLPDEASVTSIPQKRLQPPRAGFNLCVLVGKVNVVVDKLRVDRSRVRLAEVEVGDETGTVSLRARDDQIDVLQKVSENAGSVVLRNCTLELFQGKHIRLAVTKWGKLSVFPDDVASTPPPPSKINGDRNYSLIDLSAVASEMVENHPPDGGYQSSNREMPPDRNRGVPNRQPFQPPQYHQQRRNPRDRRQVRPNRGVVTNPLAVPFPEIAMPNQMRYPGMPGYGGFGESIDMQHYQYGAQRQNPESMQPTPHQMLQLQQQQYDMQQRQMQMQAFHEHGGRQRSMHRQHMQSNQLLGTPSFDSGPPEFPSLPGIVPMHGGNRAMDERNAMNPSARDGTTTSSLPNSPASETGPWGVRQMYEHNMDDSVGSSHMNPQAHIFAPSYPKGPGQPMQGGPPYPGYNPYDPRGVSPYGQQQHTIYTQNIVYVPVPGAAGGSPPTPGTEASIEAEDKKPVPKGSQQQ